MSFSQGVTAIRRKAAAADMMLVFFFGMGAAALLVSVTQSPPQVALALLGCFASIYQPGCRWPSCFS